MLLEGTGDEALKAGIIHGLQFGPFLIVNGKPIEIVGDPWVKHLVYQLLKEKTV